MAFASDLRELRIKSDRPGVGRELAALCVTKDAIVNGVGFEFKLSFYVLHSQRDRYVVTDTHPGTLTPRHGCCPGEQVPSVSCTRASTTLATGASVAFLAQVGQSTDAVLYVDGEYGFTDRFSVSAGLPFVFAKNTASSLPPPPIPVLPWDACHCWQAGPQDFAFTARYNVFNGGFALTPSVTFGVPSHDYEFRGEAVLGRNLKEVQFAVDVGRRLDAISEKLSVQGRYSYTVVERPIDIPNNRSNARWESAYQLTRRLSSYGFVWQHTHGGLSFGSPVPGAALPFPGDINTDERLLQHDRIMRDNYWHAGGGASYGFAQFDVFGPYTAYVAGTDTHAGRAFTVGVSFPFELHIGHK